MKDTDQIAAEAWKKLRAKIAEFNGEYVPMDEGEDDECLSIIKAAIEKAWPAVEKAWQDGYVEGSNYQIGISRAAHEEKKLPQQNGLITTLRAQADEIAREGHAGWGNTMAIAADTLEKLQSEAHKIKAEDTPA